MKNTTAVEAKEVLLLESLINELVKDKPNQVMVKKMMLGQGIPYSSDPVIQLGTVLSLMNRTGNAKKASKKPLKQESEL